MIFRFNNSFLALDFGDSKARSTTSRYLLPKTNSIGGVLLWNFHQIPSVLFRNDQGFYLARIAARVFFLKPAYG